MPDRVESKILMSEPLQRGCELCGSRAARELYNAGDRLGNLSFTIALCAGCGVLRTLPEMTQEELADFYLEEYWGQQEPSMEWIRESQSDKTQFITKCGLAGGRLLDVGCGAGFFLRALDEKKWDRSGVETGAEAVATARRALGSDRIFEGTLCDCALESSSFDVVTFWSALEHTNEPRANLTEARRIIKRGGTLIVQVPNAASYQARIFRGDWFALDAPRHRYHFTPARLSDLLSETGFDVQRATYFSRAHNAHALRQSLKSKLRAEKKVSAGRILFLLTIPFIRPVDLLMSGLRLGATLTLSARAV
jgi:2-polyprenyl-3-methyl-5-hydroxy-6-metoxy-1,4-benzoquinol methylase